jgi:hypothetical protein
MGSSAPEFVLTQRPDHMNVASQDGTAFSWLPIYKELAGKILSYRNRQSDENAERIPCTGDSYFDNGPRQER